MRNLRHVWFIALNNVRLFVTDRLAVGMFILFPFLFIIMFNMLLSNAGAGDQRLELHLATQETGGISQQIIQAMVTTDESQLKPGDPIIILEKDYNQAKADVEAGKLDGFLAFPADFTQNIETGKNTDLEIVAKAEATDTRMALNGLARSIASLIGSETTEINAVVALLTQQGSSPADIQKAVAQIIQNTGFKQRQPVLDNLSGAKRGRGQTGECLFLRYPGLPGDVRLLCRRHGLHRYYPGTQEPHPGAPAGQFGEEGINPGRGLPGRVFPGPGADNHLLDCRHPGLSYRYGDRPLGGHRSFAPGGVDVRILLPDAGDPGQD